MVEPNIISVIEQICQEKKLSKEQVLEALEQALASAYRKDFGERNQNIKVEFDPETGKMKAFDIKTVVEDLPEEEEEETKKPKKTKKGAEGKEEKEDVSSEASAEEERKFNPKTEIMLSEAKKVKKKAKIGDVIKTELEIPSAFGRVAAQTAKQVIVQRLREAERDVLYKEYKEQEGKVVAGIVQHQERRGIFIDLERITAVLPPHEQIREERYAPGTKLKVYLASVMQLPKGPEVIVSRRHPEIVKELFMTEIPEVASGTVEIKAIAREAGSRSKVAVTTTHENIDPIGSCIGQRGVRIQTIISELGGEKIDVIEWDEDPTKFIANALSPAKTSSIKIDEKVKLALAKVAENQLSLAIGKGGQNVRLAARLTGWKIDIEKEEKKVEKEKETEKEKAKEETKEEKKKKSDARSDSDKDVGEKKKKKEEKGKTEKKETKKTLEKK